MSAALEMRIPVIYATIILLAAAVPFFFMSGVAGAFLEPVAFAYIVGFLVSLGVALILTPGLGSLLFGFTSTPRGVSPAVSAMRKGYDALLSATVRNPVPALAVAGVCYVVNTLALIVSPRFFELINPVILLPIVLAELSLALWLLLKGIAIEAK